MDLERAQMLALELMQKHGLWETKWSFGFDNAISRLGYCNYRKKRISLGRHSTSVNPQSEVLNTLLHEIAHALVGPGFGHGSVWKEKARSIGCTAERTGTIQVQAEAKYEIICTLCSKVFKFYRRPRWLHRIDEVYCNGCGRASKGKLKLQKFAHEVGISFLNKKTLDKVTII